VKEKEESSFSEEKEAKRLLISLDAYRCKSTLPGNKSFLVLFFKKEHS
jgi:hypothetical protein